MRLPAPPASDCTGVLIRGFPKTGVYKGLYRDNGKENGSSYLGFRVSEIRGTIFECSYNKDYNLLRSILESLYSGKVPYEHLAMPWKG